MSQQMKEWMVTHLEIKEQVMMTLKMRSERIQAFKRAASRGATAANSGATGRPKCKVQSKMKMMMMTFMSTTQTYMQFLRTWTLK